MDTKEKSGGAAPFGYRRTASGFVPDPHEAPIRKLAFELFLKHKRKLTVAKELNKKGYRSRSGAKFSDSTVSRFLTDPIVKGHHKKNWIHAKGPKKYRELKPESERRYPPIEALIDEATWNRVNDLLIAGRVKPQAKKPSGVFTDYLLCYCGTEMHHPHGRKSYFCKTCDNRIDVAVIEDIFATELTNFTIDEDDLVSAQNQDATKDQSSQTDILIAEKKSVETEMDKLYDLYMSGAMSKDRFTTKNVVCEERLASISHELDALSPVLENASSENPRNLGEAWQRFSDDTKRELVELITNKIHVDKHRITIKLNTSPSSF